MNLSEEELPKALQKHANEEKINDNNKKIKKEKKSKKIWLRIIITIIILGILGISTLAFLLYGPYSGFREWLITSAMTTMRHQYLATWFYNDETIQEVLDNNKVHETDENTDTSMIVVNKENEETMQYANEYERQILEKDPEHEDYKIIKIEGKGYDGYMAVIYDPSRINTVYTSKLGTTGEYLTKMAQDNDALIAINGGGFEDPNYLGNGAIPLGITFSNGKLITSETYKGQGGLIGFTQDDKLVLGKMTVEQAKKQKIRDGVTFGPFLIVNGKASSVSGNGGWGTAPRTAIGQRQDGIVLFLVVDGRTVKRPGATMKDLIEIFERYGAYNAANLDGGTSSAMVVNNKIINDPVDQSGSHRTRYISTAFILTKEGN